MIKPSVLASAAMLLISAGPGPKPETITCSVPVWATDTLASLKGRFGKAAMIATVDGAEGEQSKALVLYGPDKARRIEVLFADDAMQQPASLRWRGKGWRAGGLGIGDGIAAITKANGKGFGFFGFDWDYGGYVTNLNGGRLAQLPGGCSLSIRLDPPAGNHTPKALIGDKKILSSNPLLKRFAPSISELTLNLRHPSGVKDDQ